MQDKTYDYNFNLNRYNDENDDPYFSVPLQKLLTAQMEINSIVQEALNKKGGGRRTRGKLRAKSRAKSRKKRRKSRRKSKGRKRRR